MAVELQALVSQFRLNENSDRTRRPDLGPLAAARAGKGRGPTRQSQLAQQLGVVKTS
jgi:hypothetical protein